MAISDPSTMFGRIGSAVILDRITNEKFPILSTGEMTYDATASSVPLYGGNDEVPIEVENEDIPSIITMNIRQYDLNILKYFNSSIASGYEENSSGDAAGFVSDLSNVTGTSVSDATTGIASAAPTSGLSPVYGTDICIKAVSATTVNVYYTNIIGVSDVLDDNMKINDTPITIPGTGGTVDIPNCNITLTGGSGTVAMTTDDIAKISARPVNSYNFNFKIGAEGACRPYFGLFLIQQQKNCEKKIRGMHFPKVKASGVNLQYTENGFSTFDVELVAVKDRSFGYASKFTSLGR